MYIFVHMFSHRRLTRILILTIGLFLVHSQHSLQAQVRYNSIDIRIDTAVHHYNAYSTFCSSLESKSITDSQLKEAESRYTAIKSEFESIMRVSSGMQYDVSAYFYNLSIHRMGFLYGVAGNIDAGYQLMTSISGYFSSQSAETFPKKYLFEGKSYTINYENFADVQLEYFVSLTELHGINGNYNEVFKYAEKCYSIQLNNIDFGNWNKYIALIKYAEASKQFAVYPDNAMEMGVRLLEIYASLNASYKQTIKENNYPSNQTGYAYLLEVYGNKPAQSNAALWLRAAAALYEVSDMTNTGQCYSYALDAGIQDRSVFPSIYTHATTMINNSLGLKACNAELALISADDCAGRAALAVYFKQFNDDATGNQLEREANDCFKEAERIAQQEEKERKRRQRREDRNFSVYAGFYPIPLMTLQNNYRDYGGVVGFGFHKFSMEGSYKLINRNVVTMEDLTFNEIDYPEERILWDGYRAHVAFKFGDRGGYDGDMFYGPLFEIVDKKYTPVPSMVMTPSGVTVGSAVFNPTELSYNAYLNFGLHVEQNHFMFDYFIGVGGSYSTFDVGNADYDPAEFDFSNTLLQNRKPERFGPIIRFGITLGLTTLD